MPISMVNAGDTVTGATLAAGDDQQVYGVSNQTIINASAAQHVFDGGAATDTVINNGGIQVGYFNGVSSSSLVGTTINYGGTQIVYGQAQNTIVGAGGTQIVYGSADGTQVSGSGTMVASLPHGSTGQLTHISIAGTPFATGVVGGGQLIVNSGTALSGGYLNASNGIQLAPAVYDYSSGSFVGSYGASINLEFLQYQQGHTFVSFNDATDILTVNASNTTYDIQLSGNYTGVTFTVSSDLPGNDHDIGSVVVSGALTIPVCFAAGTRIATPAGPIAIEEIEPGDLVLTKSNGPKRVRWTGSFRPNKAGEALVLVRKGALGDAMPAHDLRVTRGHSFLINDLLVPIGDLVNGQSILWDDGEPAEVFHVALADHDVLIVEGAFAESYRDDGNRARFHRACGYDLGLQMLPCAPFVTGGAELDAIWQSFADRAHAAPLTNDADLHLIADGNRINPIYVDGGLFSFRIDAPIEQLAIRSRACVPAHIGFRRDVRKLGVALRGCMFASPEGTRSYAFTDVEFDRPDHRAGFHAVEDGAFRWTKGEVVLPERWYSGLSDCEVTLDVHCFSTYPA
jgi:autotransporter passenger strand-loop-strand repeat protein